MNARGRRAVYFRGVLCYFTVPSEGVVATARCGDWELPPNPDAEPDRLLLGVNTIFSLRNNSGNVNGYSWQVFVANVDRKLFAYGTDAEGAGLAAGPRRHRGRCRGRRAGWARTRSVRGSRRQSRGRCRRGGR